MPAALLLLAIALVAHWPQVDRTAWIGTEARRVLIAHSMVESGEILVPQLGGEPTLTKPPLFYWMLAASEALLGRSQIAMRLPSLLALWLCALAAWRALRPRFGLRAALFAGLGVLCSPVMLWHGAFAEIDPVFAALTAISILWLGEGVASGGRRRFVAAGLAGALALMTKGPPYLMFFAGAALVWWRHARLRGFLWFAVPCVLPFAAYYAWLALASPVSADRVAGVATEETVARMLRFDWRSFVNIPVHLLRCVLVVMPFGLFALTEYRGRHDARLSPHETVLRVCSAASVSAVLVLALFPSRPVRYLLPAALTFLIAAGPAVAAYTRVPLAPRGWQIGVVRGVGAVAALAVAVLPFVAIFPLPGWSWIGAGLIAALSALVRGRSGIVAWCVAAPVIVVFTVLSDRDRNDAHGTRSERDVAAVAAEAAREHGIAELEFYGNVDTAFALEFGPDVPWNERMQREPATDWILVDERPSRSPGEHEADFVQRVRVTGKRRTFVLKERAPR